MDKNFFKPDYDHWLKLGSWNKSEAILLLIGVSPDVVRDYVSEHKITNKRDTFKILEELPEKEMIEVLENSRKLDMLLSRGLYSVFPSVSPRSVLEWIVKNKISVPDRLITTAKELGLLSGNISARAHDRLEAIISKQKKQLAKLVNENAELRAKQKETGKHVIETRAKILGVALYCVVNLPQECKDSSGHFKATKIANTVNKYISRWFADDHRPKESTILDKISQSLKEPKSSPN